jgi:hypothetical protein
MNQIESSTAVTYSSQNCIQFDDLSNVTISGHDPARMRDWNPFSITPGSQKWVSTGMIPQSLLLHLKHCWYITEVRQIALPHDFDSSSPLHSSPHERTQITVIAHGVDEILLSIEGSLNKTPLHCKERFGSPLSSHTLI